MSGSSDPDIPTSSPEAITARSMPALVEEEPSVKEEPKLERLWPAAPLLLVFVFGVGLFFAAVHLGWFKTEAAAEDEPVLGPLQAKEIVPADPEVVLTDSAILNHKETDSLQIESTVAQAETCPVFNLLNEDMLCDIGNAMFAEPITEDGCTELQLHFWDKAVECGNSDLPDANQIVCLYWQATASRNCGETDALARLNVVKASLVDPPEGLLYTEDYRQLVAQMLAELPLVE